MGENMIHRRTARTIALIILAAALWFNPVAWGKPAPKNVSLRFSSTPIPVVLRTLAEQVGFDLVVGPGIESEIDVNLNDVPWETALDAVLSANGMSYHWRDNVLVVLATTADGGGYLTHQVVTLRYANPAAVKTILAGILKPPAKAELLQSVAVGPAGGPVAGVPPVLVISESPQAMPAILTLIDSLDVQRPQFEIEVKFVETAMDDKLGVGFNWPTRINASISSNDETDDIQTVGPAAEYDIPDGKIWKFGTLNVAQLSGFLEMLKQKGKSKLLSDPRVTVVESERAVMRVATTIPVQTLNRFSEGGTIQDIVSFQDLDVGITLAVTPRMNEGGYMTLDVEPIVEEITGFTGPAENQRPITSKRTVRTTVRVMNNETVVIGGLVRETDISTKSKIFLLGDIPLLGALFTHHKISKEKTDLLIFITPHVLEPVAAN
jgi:type II secretory pathway component GspD/PulD (secretin)